MNLKDVGIKGSYTGKGEKILNDFLLPSLDVAIKYDRIAGYFSVDSLISIANGIDSLRKKHGKMRLIIGIHSLPQELIEATLNKDKLKEEITKINLEIESEIKSLQELLDKKKIATLAWMIEDGLLTVRAAAVQGEGIFHPKTIIIKDNDNNEVAAVGSSNETRNGLGGNFEQLMVASSWNNPDAVNDQKYFFDTLWSNENYEAVVVDITEEIVVMIQKSLGNEYEYLKKSLSFTVDDVLDSLSNMPLNFFVSGIIPSLYMHQERAVIDALSRWPVRVLFSDEVGLGKTFEAAATLAFLNKYCNVQRIIILTPKSVLKQWQDELKTHFGLDVWVYDSGKKEYVAPNNSIIKMNNGNPLGRGSPNLILMSAQYARGNKNSKGIFSKRDTILPQLLVVDEAHSARISEDLSGINKKTQMYKMLENVSMKIPHIILATATPMQKKAVEYHAMLKLLGLPKIWEKEENFMDSLRFIMSNHINDLSDANKIVSLLHYTYIKMKPNLSVLTSEEKVLLNQIEILYGNKDSFDKANFVKKEWSNLKNLFIKLHPARLLTVRNTRRSLSEIGYKFPERNLYEKALYESNEIKLFYADVNRYLEEECFDIEKELNPDKKLNTSFIKISYQQRVASSLYSCKMSLERRKSKIEELQKQLELNNKSLHSSYTSNIDDFDADDLLYMDTEEYDANPNGNINMNNLRRAINKEYFSLSSLVSKVNDILKSEGDCKIDESIDLAINILEGNDSVLLFSRYTDTVESLVKSFNIKNQKYNYNYAIYTGNKSVIVRNNIENECDKNQIKKALFSKDVRIVFCSDAASEGLNLQAARVLINVDVPWTPARLEQRIGRVARLGQLADEVDIYNIWYPNSVEAKMYHRIQNRLKGVNIAIGEFPEVVADNIKYAILNNEDDKSLEMLKNIRNDMQKDALNELWSNNIDSLTQSDIIRKKLIDLCKKEYRVLNRDEPNRKYLFGFDNEKESVELTDLPGQKESVNLRPGLILHIKKTIYGFKLIKNNQFNICLIDVNTNRIIKTESILNYLINGNLQDCSYYDGYPAMLVNPKRLDLSYAVEDYNKPAPIFWIEKDNESK